MFLLRLSRFEVISARFSKTVIPVLKQFLTGDKTEALRKSKPTIYNSCQTQTYANAETRN